jgi:5-hydroxyisourate hydrolase
MSVKSPITTHVLDTGAGRPARGVPVRLELRTETGAFEELARGVTDEDGRVTDLLAPGTLGAATYRITFETGPYFERTATANFYPEVAVMFTVHAPTEHHHVPLLLSPFGYSTYRGS